MAVTILRRSPPMRVMSEAAIATSVPVPMAMPRSAWASAGASLIPSPTMATVLPPALEGRHLGGLLLRQHLRQDVPGLDPHLAGDGLGRGAVVAGEHPDLEPQGPQLGHRLRRLRLEGVGDGDQAGPLAVEGDVHRRRAGLRQRSGPRPPDRSAAPRLRSSAPGCPAGAGAPRRPPGCPSRSRPGTPRPGADRAPARARGPRSPRPAGAPSPPRRPRRGAGGRLRRGRRWRPPPSRPACPG